MWRRIRILLALVVMLSLGGAIVSAADPISPGLVFHTFVGENPYAQVSGPANTNIGLSMSGAYGVYRAEAAYVSVRNNGSRTIYVFHRNGDPTSGFTVLPKATTAALVKVEAQFGEVVWFRSSATVNATVYLTGVYKLP